MNTDALNILFRLFVLVIASVVIFVGYILCAIMETIVLFLSLNILAIRGFIGILIMFYYRVKNRVGALL